jgi:hypothetical protein
MRSAGLDLATNIQESRMNNFILQIENSKLAQILGLDLLAYLRANLTNVNIVALLPFVKDFLIFATYDKYLSEYRFFNTPVGITQKRSDFSNDLEINQLQLVIDNNLQICKIKEGFLNEYLCDNSANYPLWCKSEKGAMSNRSFRRSKLINNNYGTE